MNLPTILLIVQLAVGVYAAIELVRAIHRKHVGLWTIGQVILSILLLTLAIDGLWFQTDVVGRLAYDLDIDAAWVRPGTIGVILVGTILWMFDR
ncbi:MAG: hypothetical protein EPO26_10435 [Chloroflexota bacterium]|nr:MAG: hypothetical protein EPO26_10435 [Chloroflexota bacterium]